MAGIETEGHPFRTRTVTPPLEATELLKRDGIRYSICTLVNSPDQYRAMEHSFQAAGFTGDDVEFLYLDNVGGNRFDAYAGVNLFLALARGEFIILCLLSTTAWSWIDASPRSPNVIRPGPCSAMPVDFRRASWLCISATRMARTAAWANCPVG
jgi:hypothetical protein